MSNQSLHGPAAAAAEELLPLLRRICEKLQGTDSAHFPLQGIEVGEVCYGLYDVTARYRIGERTLDCPTRLAVPVCRTVRLRVFDNAIFKQERLFEFQIRGGWTMTTDHRDEGERLLEEAELLPGILHTEAIMGFVSVYRNGERIAVATSSTSLREKHGANLLWERSFGGLEEFVGLQREANEFADGERHGPVCDY